MKRTILFITGILTSTLVISGCDVNPAPAKQTTNPGYTGTTGDKNNILSGTFENPVIKADRDTYHPTMSSTVGIGLTATFTGSKDIKFHWTTDYGYLLSWNPPDFIVKNLGNDVVNNGEKVYWSYDGTKVDNKSHDFKINLVIEGLNTDKTLPQAVIKGNVDETGLVKIISF